MPTRKPLHRRPLALLTARDFTYVNDEVYGRSYQNGPYLIQIGITSYAASYRGKTFAYGIFSVTDAIEQCARHEEERHNQEANANS